MKRTVGYTFGIEHIDCEKFYIQVTAPNGCYAYDGYWNQLDATIQDALQEALIGSGLIKRPQPDGTKG
jgi:hypothetical protein